MRRVGNPSGSTKAVKAAPKGKGAARQSSVKKGPVSADAPRRPVQISIFDYAVTIGVLLFQEPADRSTPGQHRQRENGPS